MNTTSFNAISRSKGGPALWQESLYEGLSSRLSLLQEIIGLLHQDVLKQFRFFNNFNKSLKMAIFGEFQLFSEAQGNTCPEIADYQFFTHHILRGTPQYRRELSHFAQIYCHRVTLMYLLKARFMSALGPYKKGSLTIKDLFNPGHFLAHFFQIGKARVLQTEGLRTNHYSWYRPSEELLPCLNKLLPLLSRLLVDDIFPLMGESLHYGRSSSLHFTPSTKHYGTFLKTLLVQFPKWCSGPLQPSSLFPYLSAGHFGSSLEKETRAKTVSCKIVGDSSPLISYAYLSDSSIEELGGDEVEDVVLCDFVNEEKNKDVYFKYTQEILLLTKFLTEIKGSKTLSLPFICDLFKQKKEQGNHSLGEQMNLFADCEATEDPFYDRIVLNLLHFPKNNPHFFLVNRILTQQKSMKEDGLLYVLSSKKLFVPSQRDKVEQLLDIFNLEGTFTFGQSPEFGDVAPYVYIFSKKTAPTPWSKVRPNALPQSKKRPCLSFRFSGEISEYGQFSELNEALSRFFQTKSCDATTMYQAELNKTITFEFYQDAILDGRLINSSSKDTFHITHPSFFKHLVRSCLTLDKFFHLTHIRNPSPLPEERVVPVKEMIDGPLALFEKHEQNYSYILIVDFRNVEYPQLEFCTPETYPAKLEEYGMALCHYFGLVAKMPNCNINIFREFFGSSIGQQMIQLSLTGGTSKLKAKVSSLLIPKFFATAQEIPTALHRPFDLLTKETHILSKMSPQVLQQQLDGLLPTLEDLGNRYPWGVVGLLSYFKNNLQKMIASFNRQEEAQRAIDYTHPSVIEALLKAPMRPFYPYNPDLFVEFRVRSPQELNTPLTAIEFLSNSEDGACLELYTHNKLILKVYADREALHFLSFLLHSAIGAPIKTILKTLSFPEVATLKTIISHFQNQKIALKSLHAQVTGLTESLFKNQLIQRD